VPASTADPGIARPKSARSSGAESPRSPQTALRRGALLCGSGKSAIGFFHGHPALAVLNYLPGWSPPVPAFEADDSYCDVTRGGR